jgi:environmental stress-induced protein Ves
MARMAYFQAEKRALRRAARRPTERSSKKRILFCQNEAEKLLKTKDRALENRQNKPETNLKRS